MTKLTTVIAGVLALGALTATGAPAGAAPSDAEPLPLDERGHAHFYTKSGKTYCGVDVEDVSCGVRFTTPPEQSSSEHTNAVRFHADGTIEYLVADADVRPTLYLDYKTYTALGWTIEATEAGTRFTNDGTGHGMFVSVEGVYTF